MTYKILHFADLHLDASFAGQGFPLEFGIERRLDLRAALTRILAHARELHVDAITIGGDLFVKGNLLQETADFILQQLTLLAPIRVIISPGENDPFTDNSIYSRMNWPGNVNIFNQGRLSSIKLADGINIWGASCPPSHDYKPFEGFRKTAGAIDILLLHTTEYKQGGNENNNVFIVDGPTIKNAGFDFALLGHEHKGRHWPKEFPDSVYPGSPEPLDSSEQEGEHQLVILEIENGKCRPQFLRCKQWNYRQVQVDLSDCQNLNEAENKIKSLIEKEIKGVNGHYFLKVILAGVIPPGLDLNNLNSSIQNNCFISFETHFHIGLDLEKLAREKTVRGMLVQKYLTLISQAKTEQDRKLYLTSLNFALQSLEGKKVCLYETE